MRKTLTAVAAAVAVAGLAGYGIADASAPARSNQPATAVSPHVTAPAVSETSFVAITPCRVVDTRVSGGTFADGEARAYHVRGSAGIAAQGGKSGGCGVPLTATSVAITLTAFGTSGSGRFVAYPGGTSAPDASTARYSKGLQSSGSTAVLLGANTANDLRIKNDFATSSLLIDVTGYYAAPMNAFVQSDGTLTYSSGRALASSHSSTGNYDLTFDRDISRCAYTVTPYAQNWSVAVGPIGTNALHVYIHDPVSPFTAHDTSFFVQVTC